MAYTLLAFHRLLGLTLPANSINHHRVSLPSSDAEFHLRVRQAILVAQTSARQFGLLLCKCSGTIDATAQYDENRDTFDKSFFMQIRNALRDSDTIVQLPNRVLGVLLPSVRSIEDIELVIWRILGKIEEAFCHDVSSGNGAPT